MGQLIKGILAVLLLGLLTACSVGGVPAGLVQRAIALELSQTGQSLGQQLRLPQQQDVTITRLNIQEQTPLRIQGLTAYRVQGTYNLVLNLGDRRVSQQQNPFDLYLQRQPEGKTWRLARPGLSSDNGPTWETQLVP